MYLSKDIAVQIFGQHERVRNLKAGFLVINDQQLRAAVQKRAVKTELEIISSFAKSISRRL